jgi:cytochrome c-type biogenesis protein
MTSTPGDRRSRRAARRAEARRGTPNASSTPRWLLPGLIGGGVLVAAFVAFVLPGIGGPSSGGSSTDPPSASAGAGTSGVPSAKVPVITGTPLPAFDDPANDAAVGLTAPTVDGADFTGAPVSVTADGRPKVLLFLSHSCPHCQAEVPVLQAWADTGGVPDGVDVISVASNIDPSAPNYPPDAWLEREGWTFPVIVDPTNSVMQAYGLTAFPYFVFIGPDGTVKARAVGELTPADLEAAIRGMTAS